ncbi:sugar ABC transporter permease [Streptomyces sp.]|uniref:sugar ABC transporter permease n=1 Tax=Streptomyces sp. TaxID=1931 RepID=UPI0039C90FD0
MSERKDDDAPRSAAVGRRLLARVRSMDGLHGAAGAFRRRLRRGELGSAPAVLGLIVIWIVFQSLDSAFLSPRNLTNLSVDSVGLGMIAVGVVFVLLIGEVDLAVGSVSGLSAAVFVVLNVDHGLPEWLAVVFAVLSGAGMGAVHGFVFARIGVPSFAVTLAGLLAWNSLMIYVLGAMGTVNFDDTGLVAQLTSRSFDHDAVAYGLAALVAAAFFLASYRDGRRREAAGTPARPPAEIVARTAVIAVVAFAAAYVLNRFRGVPLAPLIFLVVVAGLDYVLRGTPYGRRVYALGGSTVATRRAGISLVVTRISVFVVSGTMAAIGGLFLASRITSVSQLSGQGILVINAIAAAVIGGTSLFGGRGRTWSALLGVLVIQSIASGMALLDTQVAVQFLITAGVLLVALINDSLTRRSQQIHGRL